MQRDSIDFSSSDVGKLFRRFLFPTVMGMVFSAVFVITDGKRNDIGTTMEAYAATPSPRSISSRRSSRSARGWD